MVWTPSQLANLYGRAVPPPQPSPALQRAANLRAQDWARINAGNVGPRGASMAARYAPSTLPTPPAPSSSLSRMLPVAGRLMGGVGMAMYPSSLGDGTMTALEQNPAEQQKLREYIARMTPTGHNVGAGADAPNPGTLPAPQAALPQPSTAPSSDRMDAQKAGISQAEQVRYRDQGDAVQGYAPIPNDSGFGIKYRNSRQIGTGQFSTGQPFEPSVGRPQLPDPNAMAGERRLIGPAATTSAVKYGGSDYPLYETQYKTPQGSMTITGPDRRMGGGTLSVMDQGNGGTVAGNVGAINRQTEALRSRNEAFNAANGVGTRAFGDVVSIGTPGGHYGDEQMQQQKLLGMLADAGRPGIGRSRRQALLQAAGQMASLPQPPGVRRLQESTAPGIDPYQFGKLQIEQQKLGLDQQRLGMDQERAQYDADIKNLQYQLDRFSKLPKLDQETRLSQLQAAYYAESEQNGNDSPEAKRLAGILNLFGRVRPEMDWLALAQQQQQK